MAESKSVSGPAVGGVSPCATQLVTVNSTGSQVGSPFSVTITTVPTPPLRLWVTSGWLSHVPGGGAAAEGVGESTQAMAGARTIAAARASAPDLDRFAFTARLYPDAPERNERGEEIGVRAPCNGNGSPPPSGLMDNEAMRRSVS